MARVILFEALPFPTPAAPDAIAALVGIVGGFGRICPTCAEEVAESLRSGAARPRLPCWAKCDASHVDMVEAAVRRSTTPPPRSEES